MTPRTVGAPGSRGTLPAVETGIACPDDRLGVVGNLQLGEDARNVVGERLAPDRQVPGDRWVEQPLPDGVKDHALAFEARWDDLRREGSRPVQRRQFPARDGGEEDGRPGGNRPCRSNQRVCIRISKRMSVRWPAAPREPGRHPQRCHNPNARIRQQRADLARRPDAIDQRDDLRRPGTDAERRRGQPSASRCRLSPTNPRQRRQPRRAGMRRVLRSPASGNKGGAFWARATTPSSLGAATTG